MGASQSSLSPKCHRWEWAMEGSGARAHSSVSHLPGLHDVLPGEPLSRARWAAGGHGRAVLAPSQPAQLPSCLLLAGQSSAPKAVQASLNQPGLEVWSPEALARG